MLGPQRVYQLFQDGFRTEQHDGVFPAWDALPEAVKAGYRHISHVTGQGDGAKSAIPPDSPRTGHIGWETGGCGGVAVIPY